MRAFSTASAIAALSLLASCTALVDTSEYTIDICDPVTAEGCSSTETCTVSATAERSCVAAGTRSPGMACSSATQCVRGADCLLFALPDRGICIDYCNVDANCNRQPESRGCLYTESFGVGQCLMGCDPADPGACGSGVACYAMGNNSSCSTTGPRVRMEECNPFTFEGACAPGFVCLSAGDGVSRCFVQCGPGLASCDDGFSCLVLLNDGSVRGATSGEWGACANNG